MCILGREGGERVWGLEDSRMHSTDRSMLSNATESQTPGFLSLALLQQVCCVLVLAEHKVCCELRAAFCGLVKLALPKASLSTRAPQRVVLAHAL